MLYTRLLRFLYKHGKLSSAHICGVIFDSSPDPGYNRGLLKQVAIACVASVLKNESIPGMGSVRTELGLNSQLRAAINASCEYGTTSQPYTSSGCCGI